MINDNTGKLSKDLANYNSPVTNMFRQPASAKQWEEYMLTEAQISFFTENGYLNNIKILTEQQVDTLNNELTLLQSPNEEEKSLFYPYESNESKDPEKMLFHAIGAWRVAPGFHDLLWFPAFRMAAYQLMGQYFSLFHDQLFCKPARHGGVVAWHQDYSYSTFTKPMHHLTCWIGLDDAKKENGCLYFVPGSHKWGLLPITGLTGDMDAVREVLNADQLAIFEKRVASEMPKGYASFHHPLTMHGSYANSSERPRRAIVINSMDYQTKGNTAGYERLDALSNFPKMPQDKILNSRFFPILFEGDKELENLGHQIPMVKMTELYHT